MTINGKESQQETNWLDYGARMYDPAVGRWMAVDPLTEKQEAWSPYHYTYGNPIRFNDPDGRQPCCGDEIGGFVEGVGEALVRNVRALTIDLPQTLQGVANMTSPLGQIQTAVGANMLYEKTLSDWNTGDTRTRANIIGNVVGEVAIAVAGSKGASSLGKAGKISEIVTLDAKAIRFSQNSVTGAAEIEASMAKNGWKGGAIDVVKMTDGKLTTLDNTRVLAASRTKTPVKAKVHEYDSPIPSNMAERFPSKKGTLPNTYGQAVENRIQNQASGFRKRYPQGGNITGSIE
ncbi:RHS repeat-associated core domain-containing protein [Larkinella sp. VNQ87]